MPSPRLFVLLAALAFALTAPAAALGADPKASRKAKQEKKSGGDSLPELISTEGPDARSGGRGVGLISPDAGRPAWKSLKELEKFAEKGDPAACMELGQRLLDGNGLAADLVRARQMFEKAAGAGVPDAFFRLGKIHHDGLGVPADPGKGFEYFLEAARRNVPEAQYNVGAQLASGRGVRRNYVEGLAWLIVATESGAAGDGEAQLRARLKGRPADIAAGEKRAAAIIAAMAKGAPVEASANVRTTAGNAANVSPRPANPLPEPPAVERPRFEPGKAETPKVTVPIAPLPAPALPGRP
ncbi:MAG TPA: hypothetical protein VEB66_07475 [Opitutaceae bacterium]|nr:hypothetical protein [Opitutaceae bacterium]